jgi:hypothetical protein
MTEEPHREHSSTLKDILNSTVLTALITVLLGGVLSNYIIANYQEHAKEHARELADRKELLKQQEEAAIAAYQLLGDAQFHAADNLSLTKTNMQPKNEPDPVKKKLLIERREKIKSDVTDFMKRWTRQKYVTGMLLVGYFDDRSVQSAWNDAQSATDAMLLAAQNQNDDENRNALIITEEQNFEKAEERLALTLAIARQQSRARKKDRSLFEEMKDVAFTLKRLVFLFAK